METLTVHTARHQWSYPKGNTKAYQKVVGMCLANGQELWVPPKTNHKVYKGVDRNDLATRTLELPKGGSAKVAQFFVKGIIKKLRTHWMLERPDCHAFAFWMCGETPISGFNVVPGRLAHEALSTGELTNTPLALGQYGVIGYKTAKEVHPYHSVIGLGGDEVLQVMGEHGPLAISTTVDVTQHYTELPGLAVPDGAEYGVHVN